MLLFLASASTRDLLVLRGPPTSLEVLVHAIRMIFEGIVDRWSPMTSQENLDSLRDLYEVPNSIVLKVTGARCDAVELEGFPERVAL